MEEDPTSTILAELGSRLRQERLNQQRTQRAVAERAGIRQATLSRVENGEDFTMETLIAVLRSLGRLGNLDAFLPAPSPSPISLAESRGVERQRVRSRAAASDDSWEWGDGS